MATGTVSLADDHFVYMGTAGHLPVALPLMARRPSAKLYGYRLDPRTDNRDERPCSCLKGRFLRPPRLLGSGTPYRYNPPQRASPCEFRVNR
jgi:hypothetical protein